MRELYDAVPITLGPATQEQDFIRVRCYCDFEGHGRASNTWDEHWEIEFPHIRSCWKGTNGWNKRDYFGMKFHGRSFEGVKRKALEFLEEGPVEVNWMEFEGKPWLDGLYAHDYEGQPSQMHKVIEGATTGDTPERVE